MALRGSAWDPLVDSDADRNQANFDNLRPPSWQVGYDMVNANQGNTGHHHPRR